MVPYGEIVSFHGITEPVASLLHFAGAGVATIAAVILIRRGRGHWLRVASLGVFAFSAIFLLCMSGLYHLLSPELPERAFFQRLDHAGIWMLIAGTFTPIHVILMRRGWRWGMLAILWAVALAGITLKTLFFHELSEGAGLSLYLGVGWLGVITLGRLTWERGVRFASPLVTGGMAYSVGAVMEFFRWPVLLPGVVGPHEVLHFAVLSGLALHWSFIQGWADLSVE